MNRATSAFICRRSTSGCILREGALTYVRGGGSATELGALEPGHFVMIGPQVRIDVTFATGKEGAPPTMTVAEL